MRGINNKKEQLSAKHAQFWAFPHLNKQGVSSIYGYLEQ